MPKLELVADKERLERRIATLEMRLPALQVEAKSSFFAILGCYVPAPLNDAEKTWLQAMIDAGIIHRYRCKEREDR